MEETEEEFEEFESDDEDEEDEKPVKQVPKQIPPRKHEKKQPRFIEEEEEVEDIKKAVVKKPVAEPEKETQYVAVPRAVSVETMFNELYDGMQEIKAMLQELSRRAQ